jgi:hypothetical protein
MTTEIQLNDIKSTYTKHKISPLILARPIAIVSVIPGSGCNIYRPKSRPFSATTTEVATLGTSQQLGNEASSGVGLLACLRRLKHRLA